MFEELLFPLKGFRFANHKSRENAVWLNHWMARAAFTKPGEEFRPPMVVITGPPASGKTELVRRAVEAAGLSRREIVEEEASSPASLGRAMNKVAAGCGKLLWIDPHAPVLRHLDRSNIGIFIGGQKHGSARGYSYRPLCCLTVVTAQAVEMSDDLRKRCVCIELEVPLWMEYGGPAGSEEEVASSEWTYDDLQERLKTPFLDRANDARGMARKAGAKGDNDKAAKHYAVARAWKRAAQDVADLDVPF